MTFRMKARRAGWLLVVAAFAFGIVSAIRPAPTHAYGLISSRYIKMSSSEISATNVIYQVGFNTVTNNQTIGAVVIKFCSNNPILGDTCTAPAGLNVNNSTLTIANPTGGTLAGSLSVSTSQGGTNVLVLTRTPGNVVNQAVGFDLGNGSTTGITNPSTNNSTFFARILIFASNTPSLSQASETALVGSGGPSDAGGVALAMVSVLNVTAKVQESLVFCVYTGVNCAAGGNAIALGDSNGVLAATNTTYLDATPKFDLASNALNGIIVRLKGDTLTSGAFTITPNGNSCVADAIATGTEQFGARVVTYGTGQVVPVAGRYDCNAGNHMFDPAQTNTTYGDSFVKTVGATDVSTTNFELAAKAASTTEAGVYTTKLQLIATATY
jgi:hypothetical protein